MGDEETKPVRWADVSDSSSDEEVTKGRQRRNPAPKQSAGRQPAIPSKPSTPVGNRPGALKPGDDRLHAAKQTDRNSGGLSFQRGQMQNPPSNQGLGNNAGGHTRRGGHQGGGGRDFGARGYGGNSGPDNSANWALSGDVQVNTRRRVGTAEPPSPTAPVRGSAIQAKPLVLDTPQPPPKGGAQKDFQRGQRQGAPPSQAMPKRQAAPAPKQAPKDFPVKKDTAGPDKEFMRGSKLPVNEAPKAEPTPKAEPPKTVLQRPKPAVSDEASGVPTQRSGNLNKNKNRGGKTPSRGNRGGRSVGGAGAMGNRGNKGDSSPPVTTPTPQSEAPKASQPSNRYQLLMDGNDE